MGIREIDSHKLNYHPERVVEWLKNGNCFPIHVEMGITNRCNHSCEFCTLSWINHGSAELDIEVLKRTIKEFSEIGVKSIYLAGEGEPTLHKDLTTVVKTAYDNNIKVSMSTNGSILNDNIAEYLSWIRFSLDSINPITYSKMHGVNKAELFKVLRNITKLVNIKQKNNLPINIGVQAIFEPKNAKEMVQMGELLRDIGVDNFQVKPAHNHPKSSYTPEVYDFSSDQIVKDLENLETKNFSVVVRLQSLERLKVDRNYTECHGFHFYGLVDANGSVVPCNVFYNNPEFIYGNINETSFKDIWMGDRRKNIIETLSKSNHKYCGNYRCRLDVMNRYLQRVKYPDQNDEFI
jgi:radical SAM protein with 4Fe4S-binding SPASM domain